MATRTPSYPEMESRIAETYAARSTATQQEQLYTIPTRWLSAGLRTESASRAWSRS